MQKVKRKKTGGREKKIYRTKTVRIPVDIEPDVQEFKLGYELKINGKKKMRVLVACEESQTVTKAFRKLGHEAFSCDIQECSGGHPEWHFKMDVFNVIPNPKYPMIRLREKTQDGTEVKILPWDLLIGHPPCTFISNAGARFLYPKGILNQERYLKGMEGKNFFMDLLECGIPKICIENPVSSKVFEMPKCTQEIQPYQFGHPYTKKTRLWLKNLPTLKPTKIVGEPKAYISSNTGGKKRGQKTQIVDTYVESTKMRGNWFNKGGKDRQKARSVTFQGIADAMAEQWG